MAAVLELQGMKAAEEALSSLRHDHAYPSKAPEWVTAKGLAALGTEVAEVAGAVAAGPSPPSVEQLWHHEQLVEAVSSASDAVPLRYGVRFASSSAASSALEAASGTLYEDLAHISSSVELSVRMLVPGRHVRQPSSSGSEVSAATGRGAAASDAPLPTAADIRRQASVVHRRLRDASIAAAPPRLGEGRWALVGAYLVQRGGTAAFVDLVGRLETPRARLFCTGPWPPYNFVRGPATLASLAD